MRCCFVVALALLLGACAAPPVQNSAFDTPSQNNILAQNTIPDSTEVVDIDTPLDETSAPLPVTNDPYRTPEGPTATQSVPATLLATPIDYVEYVGFTHFVNEDQGWMWNHHTVFSTDDGGRRWDERWISPFPTLQWIPTADFISAQQGWVVVTGNISNTSSLITTADGVATWNEVPIDPNLGAVYWIDFVDTDAGWMVAGDRDQTAPIHLLHTTDGGITWTEVSDPCTPGVHQNTRSISFGSRTNGWALCTTWDGYTASTQLFATTDGGQHWQERTLLPVPPAPPSPPGYPYGSNPATPVPPAPAPPPPPIVFVDELHGWIGEQYGNVLRTADGGATWQYITVVPDSFYAVNAMQFWSTTQGVVSVNGASFHTNDGGATWQPNVSYLRPSQIQFFDPQNGVGMSYAGEEAVLLRTGDGGRSWSMAGEIPPDCPTEAALHFVDPTHGWSLGQNRQADHAPPILCHTTDGGRTWTQMPDLAVAGAAAISFLDANTGYLGSTGSTYSMLTSQLQLTHDGGATWTPVSTEPVTANQIEFLSPEVGWKLADWQLSATEDGGVSWTPIPLGYRVTFFDLLPGGAAWVLAETCNSDDCERFVLSTTDNGATWTNHVFDAAWITPPAPGKPDPIASPDPAHIPYVRVVLQQITAITFVDAQHGWLVQAAYYQTNEQRRLWATTDGGRTWTMLE